MRNAVASMLLLGLGGCDLASEIGDKDQARGSSGHGRYVGAGLYGAGRLWPQMVRPKNPAKDASNAVTPSPATLADDSTIIVVVDSATGEIRQCGDVSGFCTTMNPWTKRALGAPVVLAKHAADLDAEATAREHGTSPR